MLEVSRTPTLKDVIAGWTLVVMIIAAAASFFTVAGCSCGAGRTDVLRPTWGSHWSHAAAEDEIENRYYTPTGDVAILDLQAMIADGR